MTSDVHRLIRTEARKNSYVKALVRGKLFVKFKAVYRIIRGADYLNI